MQIFLPNAVPCIGNENDAGTSGAEREVCRSAGDGGNCRLSVDCDRQSLPPLDIGDRDHWPPEPLLLLPLPGAFVLPLDAGFVFGFAAGAGSEVLLLLAEMILQEMAKPGRQ